MWRSRYIDPAGRYCGGQTHGIVEAIFVSRKAICDGIESLLVVDNKTGASLDSLL